LSSRSSKGETRKAAREHGLKAAVEAERALEEACLNRFGLVYPKDQENRLMLRSDNGLVFQSRRFRASSRQYGLSQEFITPYTPQQVDRRVF